MRFWIACLRRTMKVNKNSNRKSTKKQILERGLRRINGDRIRGEFMLMNCNSPLTFIMKSPRKSE